MSEKLKELTLKRKLAHSELLKRKSKVYETFLKLEEVTYADGALSKKHKELIATGISVVINCESCMQWHIEQAYSSGATEQEILEAIEVGIEMGGGPATVSTRFALEVLNSIVTK